MMKRYMTYNIHKKAKHKVMCIAFSSQKESF